MKTMLHIGASSYVGEYLLPRILHEWEENSPDSELSVHISDTQKVFEQVLAGDLDAGLIAAALEDEMIETRELVKHDELVFICPNNHPLAGRQQISVADLKGQEFVAREPGSATRMWYRERLASEGLSFEDLHIVAELGSQRAVLSAVESGAGCSFVPRQVAAESLAAGHCTEVKIKDISPLYGNLYAIWAKDRPISREIQHFIDFACANARQMATTAV